MCMSNENVHMRRSMRTNIEIDDALLDEAMAESGLTTKKATVEEALRRLVKNAQLHRAIDSMRGVGWEGDLEAMREGWFRG